MALLPVCHTLRDAVNIAWLGCCNLSSRNFCGIRVESKSCLGHLGVDWYDFVVLNMGERVERGVARLESNFVDLAIVRRRRTGLLSGFARSGKSRHRP